MSEVIENKNWAGARLKNVFLAGAVGREVDLAGARISGRIDGLILNDIEIEPLIRAELDRRHPERTKLRPTDPGGCKEALGVVESQLAATWERAKSFTDEQHRRQVDEEWSLVETVQHLIFVIDGWISKTVIGGGVPWPEGPGPMTYHRYALPPSFMPRQPAGTEIDADANPSLTEALEVWEERLGILRTLVNAITAEHLGRELTMPGQTVTSALHVVFIELWWHNRFANRDLSRIEAGDV